MYFQRAMKKKYIFVFVCVIIATIAITKSFGTMNSLESPLELDSSNAKLKISSFSDSRLQKEDIRIYEDKVIVSVDSPVIARFTDTDSMKPTFDSEANAIEIVPESPEEINVGDIASYYSNIANTVIIHRVVETGYDEQGWYAYFEGDALDERDPEKVRFNQIQRVVVMMIF